MCSITKAFVCPRFAWDACRNARKKKALADTRTALNRATAANAQLLMQLEETQSENYTVSEALRTELLARSSALADAQAQLVQVGACSVRAGAPVINMLATAWCIFLVLVTT